MLSLAIRARLPLISVHTTDPINIGKVLEHYAGTEVRMDALSGVIRHNNPKAVLGLRTLGIPAQSVCCVVGATDIDLARAYTEAAQQHSSLIIVNPEEPHPAMFDAGVVHLPDSMIREFVQEYADDHTDLHALEAALRGLSYKELVEVAQLAMAESGEFTADAVSRIRRQRTVLSSGLRLVDTEQRFYAAHDKLLDWLRVDGRLFRADVPRVIRPRGLLFDGEPGTGKTSGAKFVAHSLGAPLYLLDVGSTMQKWVGESERTFLNALSQIETLAPCVLLLDEVEKAFNTAEDDSGVSRRVLGMLLWWLQEHDVQVLTIMTTNDRERLPPELIRPGRIDDTMVFEGLEISPALVFAERLRCSLTNVCDLPASVVQSRILTLHQQRRSTQHVTWTQAELTHEVLRLIKQKVVAELKE